MVRADGFWQHEHMKDEVTHHGSCHCARVQFEVDGPAVLEAVRCNCSICRMSGFVGWMVSAGSFRMLQGEHELEEYRFNTGTARHLFCRHCGIKAFYVPRSHPDGYSVNIHCLNTETVSGIRISDFDGRNWEDHVHELAQLPRD